MAIAARVRKLGRVLSLVRSHRGGAPGIVWSEPVSVVDRDGLADGERVAYDHWIILHRPPVSEAESRERVSTGPDDRGDIYAWDGRLIGRVTMAENGGVLLGYQWPVDLDPVSPARAAEQAKHTLELQRGHASIVEGREREELRVAAELVDVEKKRLESIQLDRRRRS
jgi:hypothetical protein